MQTDWLPDCRLLHYIHLPVLYCTCVLHYTLHHLKKECEKEHRNPSRTCTFECQLFSRHISNNKYTLQEKCIQSRESPWQHQPQYSSSNEKISLASNICPFQAQQSALRAPLIPTEAPCTPSSSLLLASSPSYRPSKIHGPRKHTNQPETRKSASSRIYAHFKPNKVHCVLPR